MCVCACVQNGIHSYVNRQCMCACICRRDPYHGIMRSATVGYPQTVVIMATVKRTDAEGRMDIHTLTFSHTQASASLTACCRQSDDLSLWQWDGNRMPLTGYDKLDLHPLFNQLYKTCLPVLTSNINEIWDIHSCVESMKP